MSLAKILYYALSALAVLIVLTIHEYSHAYAAYKLGDPTAKNVGRLTLNPIKHIDPFGALCMLLFHFGWARPVPINPRNFKNPKRGFAISAMAGPLSNLVMAFISAFVHLLTYALLRDVKFTSEFTYNIAQNTLDFIYVFHIINVGIAVFNLLPVPPLDGSRLLNAILPTRAYFKVMRYERQIYFGLLAWLLLGDFVKRALLSVPFIGSNAVLARIAGIFSLNDILGSIIEFIYFKILDFWYLIPFINI